MKDLLDVAGCINQKMAKFLGAGLIKTLVAMQFVHFADV